MLGSEDIHPKLHPGTMRELAAGILRGALAGAVFLAFEVVVSGLAGAGYTWPLRLVAGILLGWGALPPRPEFSIGVVIFVALVVHFALSSAFGALFSALFHNFGGRMGASWGRNAVLSGLAFGFLLWGVDVYVLAVFFDAFPWFEQANPPVAAIGHVFFYGGVLGLLVARRFAGRRPG
ncbi:MAG: hypothetical protein K6T51_02695 [Rubrobacteraceae bacterium]|uniref:hypothetical protein n=1 Tax=Rubrobacter naiadicus TaxID=1392641 RepID=UPI0023605F22|nr:hypothetical protein [Rubrobacter naiadicus]MBX6765074.1 hypothetical protein [Rubrobacteraceae bacterium]MCL6437493.1 hypothetical protein [Rubrobacteraceae bacterium]